MVNSGTNQRKHQKLCVTGLCEGNSPVTGEFPTQRASNMENVSILWCHHVCLCRCDVTLFHVVMAPNGINMRKIRWLYDCLIFTTGILILITHIFILAASLGTEIWLKNILSWFCVKISQLWFLVKILMSEKDKYDKLDPSGLTGHPRTVHGKLASLDRQPEGLITGFT